MTMKYCILLLLPLITMCNSKSKKTDTRIDGLESLCMLKHTMTDVNNDDTFVFSKNAPWDTTFTVLLLRDSVRGVIKGIYRQTSPKDGAISTLEGGLIFFDGFTFEVDISLWPQIAQQSNFVLNTSDIDPIDEGNTDGVRYFARRGPKFTYSKTKTTPPFYELEKFLKINLLNRFLRIKKYPDEEIEKRIKEGR